MGWINCVRLLLITVLLVFASFSLSSITKSKTSSHLERGVKIGQLVILWLGIVARLAVTKWHGGSSTIKEYFDTYKKNFCQKLPVMAFICVGLTITSTHWNSLYWHYDKIEFIKDMSLLAWFWMHSVVEAMRKSVKRREKIVAPVVAIIYAVINVEVVVSETRDAIRYVAQYKVMADFFWGGWYPICLALSLALRG